MNPFFQKVLLLLTALLLASTQNYSANFCSCAGEIFESVCPCVEEMAEADDCCPKSVDCTETIEFDWGDYLPTQNEYRFSLEGADLDNPIPSVVDQLVIAPPAIALGTADLAPPRELIFRESNVFAKFVSLWV
ncbi:MAG: hypothetical protein L7V87_07825 [Verrucomicrobiales bacterium]|nr:hypothetical protein [Verrucomicrobiales bacterium]